MCYPEPERKGQDMARKRYTAEEIIQILRTVEIEQGKGISQEEAARKSGIDQPGVLLPPTVLINR